jgi:hypothetical protein
VCDSGFVVVSVCTHALGSSRTQELKNNLVVDEEGGSHSRREVRVEPTELGARADSEQDFGVRSLLLHHLRKGDPKLSVVLRSGGHDDKLKLWVGSAARRGSDVARELDIEDLVILVLEGSPAGQGR